MWRRRLREQEEKTAQLEAELQTKSKEAADALAKATAAQEDLLKQRRLSLVETHVMAAGINKPEAIKRLTSLVDAEASVTAGLEFNPDGTLKSGDLKAVTQKVLGDLGIDPLSKSQRLLLDERTVAVEKGGHKRPAVEIAAERNAASIAKAKAGG